MEKIRLLFLIHDLCSGGAEKVLVNLVNNLDKRQFEVTVQTLFDVGCNKELLNTDVNYIGGFKRMFRGNNKLFSVFSPEKLCKYFLKGEYDIVISFLEGPTTRILSAYNGKKVAWIHTDFFNKALASTGFRSFDEARSCYSKYDKVIAVSEIVREHFDNVFYFNDFCEVFYNVNDSNEIIRLSKQEQSIVKRTPNCFNIISVGKLDCCTKGYDNLLYIHYRLLQNGINNRLYIVGDGHDRSKLVSICEDLNLGNTCTLIGFDKNPYKYMNQSDLYVCSSHREGFSTAVSEALILGIPVVSTRVSGANELLGSNDEYGIVVNDDLDALYSAVLRILSDKNLLNEYREKAQRCGKYFSTEITVREVEKMFYSLMEE